MEIYYFPYYIECIMNQMLHLPSYVADIEIVDTQYWFFIYLLISFDYGYIDIDERRYCPMNTTQKPIC